MTDNEHFLFQILKDETNMRLIFKRLIINEIGNQFKKLAR